MTMQTSNPVYVFVSDDYQEMEFWYPLLRLREDHAAATVVAVDGEYTYHSRLGYPVIPEMALDDADIDGCRALLLAAGDVAAAQRDAVAAWIRRAVKAGKVVGATARALPLLKAADLALPGPSEGVRTFADNRVVTAASPDDLPAFYKTFSGLALA